MDWRKLSNRAPRYDRESFPYFQIRFRSPPQRYVSESENLSPVNSSQGMMAAPVGPTFIFLAQTEGKLVYMASPHSSGGGAMAELMEVRTGATARIAIMLLDAGVNLYSPIMMGVGLQSRGYTRDRDWWMHRDKKFLRKCDCLAVLTLNGWEKSPGVQDEIELALITGKEIFLIGEKP